MILDLVSLIHQIIITPAIQKAHRDETIVRILHKFNLDPKDPPEDFDGIYAYALVEYGIDENGKKKHEEVLELFRLQEIREAFRKAFYSGNKSTLDEAVERVVNLEEFDDWDTLGQSIINLKINLNEELEEFRHKFNKIVEESQKPAQRRLEQKIDELKNIYTTSQSSIGSISQSSITGFEALIKEKTRLFCGRKFVFEKIDDFIKNHDNGYFVVVGDAGMGKSTIAAKYVFDNRAICFFNILSEGRNTPDKFLRTIRQQLINRYDLQNAEQADLSALITQVANKMPTEQYLVIVVDALDEVEQEASAANLLNLPETLPEKVYFLLTRRPYTPDKKRLRVYVPIEKLDLTANKYQKNNRDDIEEYIDFFLNKDIDYKDALTKWINERNITDDYFIKQVAEKSENNFMYLRYVLPEIANGVYNDLSLQKLPDGLKDYYQKHWERMDMDDKPQELMVFVLFVLVESDTAIPCKMIADILDKDEYDVQSVLNAWFEYLKPQEIETETCYSIYHASFLDFLKSKRVLDSKRKLFQEVNQRIVDYWEKQMGDF